MTGRASLFSALFTLLFMTSLSGSAATIVSLGSSSEAVGSSIQEDTEKVRTTIALADEIRHQVLMLPYYGEFDWITGHVKDDGTVTLEGYVVRSATKSEIDGRVKKLAGVTNLVDNIEVLPLSPADQRIRIAVYRTLFRGGSPLFKYATMAVPSIHIVVKNGHLILEGVVDNKFDYNYANIKAKAVPGVFSVDNKLRIPGNR